MSMLIRTKKPRKPLDAATRADRRADAERSICEAIAPDSPHSSCAKAFRDLCETNIEEAFSVYQEARAYIDART